MISKVSMDEINEDIAKQFVTMEYRPVLVVMLVNKDGKVLLVQSSKNSAWWGFPQGGINLNEDITLAIFRELYEETGISEDRVSIFRHCGSNLIDISNWKGRYGFVKGKKYYYFLLLAFDQIDEIKLQLEEISDYEWLDSSEVPSRLSTVNVEKRKALLDALEIAQNQTVD